MTEMPCSVSRGAECGADPACVPGLRAGRWELRRPRVEARAEPRGGPQTRKMPSTVGGKCTGAPGPRTARRQEDSAVCPAAK